MKLRQKRCRCLSTKLPNLPPSASFSHCSFDMQHKCQQSAPLRSTGQVRTVEVIGLISIQLPGVVFCRGIQSLAHHGKLSHHPAAAVVTAAASLITTRKLFAGKDIWRHSQSCMLRPAVPVASGHTSSRYGRFALPAYVYLCCQMKGCRSGDYQPRVPSYNFLLAPAGDSAADHLDLADDLQGRFSARFANMIVPA